MGGLTFELRRHQRCDARARMAKMYRVPPAGPARHAVGARLERGVRRRALTEALAERGVQEVPRALHVMKRRAYQPGTGRGAPVSGTTLAEEARKGPPPKLMRGVMFVRWFCRRAQALGKVRVYQR